MVSSAIRIESKKSLCDIITVDYKDSIGGNFQTIIESKFRCQQRPKDTQKKVYHAIILMVLLILYRQV